MREEIKDMLLSVSTYTGLDEKDIWLTIVMCTIAVLMFGMFYIQSRINSKEFKQEEQSTKHATKLIPKYSKGNYAYDVKLFVKLYRSAKTQPEINELKIVCERIINNVDRVDMFGRSSYNGRLYAGLGDAYKAASVTLSYLVLGKHGINLIRNIIVFGVNYYGDKEDDDVLGVTRVVRTEIHYSTKLMYSRRMSQHIKKNVARLMDAEIHYQILLKRFGNKEYLNRITDIARNTYE